MVYYKRRYIEYGTKIHERLEYADFKNGNDPIVLNNAVFLIPIESIK